MATDSSENTVSEPIPRLSPGDRMTRDEFERRYAAMPHVKKAELIEGLVYMPSPVSTEGHGAPHLKLATWLGVYESQTPGVQAADNAPVRLDWDNEPQPDVFLRILPRHGGQTRDESGYVALGPEWAGEIAASSASYDLHDKKEAYRRNGIREYVVWRVEDRTIDWFVLRGGRYDLLQSGGDGVIRSQEFPGLWLDSEALLDGNTQRVLEVLQQGLQSPPHAEFVRRLQEAAS